MKFNDKEKQASGGKYLKINPGESVNVVFRGDPVEYRIHWKGGKSFDCNESSCPLCEDGDKSSFRFKLNAIVKENGAYVAKTFEQGFMFYDSLRSLQGAGYEIENHVMKVSRIGSGKETTYSVVPVPNGNLSDAQLSALASVELQNLSGRKQKELPVSCGFSEEEYRDEF